MITIEQMVSREVHYCVSYLVSTLAGSYGTHAGLSGDMSDATEQAFELACPIDDWEEAAIQEGWSVVHHIGAGWRAVKNSAATDDDVTFYTPSEVDAWRDACEANNIEPYQRDVFEHWIVSDWLADQLIAKGEKVDKDFVGLIVWARTTTGQGIASDSVIEAIYADLIGRNGESV